MARRTAVLLACVFALACTRTGEVIVLLDSTMRAGAVEVVAYPRDTAGDGEDAAPITANASLDGEEQRLRVLRDSAAALTTRFRLVRDSLNVEVASLSNVDRRSRAYAVRYAEIRRRTLAAEQIRARRDSAVARAAAARSSIGPERGPANGPAKAASAVTSPPDPPGIRRYAVRDSAVSLRLAPGRWSIGVAPRGSIPARSAGVTIVRGSRDTLRLSIR